MNISSIRSAPKFKQTALLVDDQSTVLAIHGAILKSLNMNLKIVSMTDPIAALEWMHKKQVDLIVTDYHMSQMNGVEFVKQVGQINDVAQKPIIVVTVLKDKKLHATLMKAGAAACLTKPVNPDEFKLIAKTLLQQSKRFYESTLVA